MARGSRSADPAAVDRILAAWCRALDAGHGSAGRSWYSDNAAAVVRALPGVNRDNAVACAAALAPRVQWWAVLGRLPDVARGIRGPFYRRSFDVARRALGSEDPIGKLPGPKTRDFALALLGAPVPVIDIWATRVGMPEWGGKKLTARRYAVLRESYSAAARILGERPDAVQAAVWILARGRA